MSSSSCVLIPPASAGPDRARSTGPAPGPHRASTGGAHAERLDVAGASPDKRDVVGRWESGWVGGWEGRDGPGADLNAGGGGGGEGAGASAAVKATTGAEAAKNFEVAPSVGALLEQLHLLNEPLILLTEPMHLLVEFPHRLIELPVLILFAYQVFTRKTQFVLRVQ